MFTYTDSNGLNHKNNTSRILFLFAGAFQGLDEVVKKRISTRKSIGFYSLDKKQEVDNKTLLAQATIADIEKYGFNRELLGRIGSIHYIPPLTKQDYLVLLRDGENSVQGKYARLLKANKVGFHITDEACDVIVNQAMEKNLGARAANTIVMEQFLDAIRRVDEDKTVSEVILHALDGNLVLEYSTEQNRIADVSGAEEKDISLVRYMDTESDINRFCMKLLQSYSKNEEDIEGEIITFYFLQLALRYIRTCTNKDDWNLSSIEKLAKCTLHIEENFSVENKTTFDNLIEDYMEVEEDIAVYDFDMLLIKYLYRQYKALETVKSATQIVSAVRMMKENWQ